MGPTLTPGGAGVRGAEVGILRAATVDVGIAVGGTGVDVAVGVAVGGKGVSVGVAVGGRGVAVKVAEGGGVDVSVGGCVGSGDEVAVEVGAPGGTGVSVARISGVGCLTAVSTLSSAGDDSRAKMGVSVATAAAVASAGWSEGVAGATEAESSEAVRRSVANHPPKNRAVMATHTKIDKRARRALTLSSSLTIGKIALRASCCERKAIRAAITAAPVLSAARINKIVGKDAMLVITPQSRAGQAVS